MTEMEKNCSRVKELFTKMEYTSAKDSTDLVEAWLKKKGPNFEFTVFTTETVERNCNEKEEHQQLKSFVNELDLNIDVSDKRETQPNCRKFFTSVLEKTLFMEEFLKLIEKNEKFLIELEMTYRGFSQNDAKISIDLFKEYLKCYSSYLNLNNEFEIEHVADSMPLWLIAERLGKKSDKHYSIRAHPRSFIIIHAIYEIIADLCKKYDISLVLIPLSYRHRIRTDYDFCSKSPFLIFNGADLDSAVDSAIDAAWRDQGIMPWCTDTLIVQECIAEEFTRKLKARLEKLRIGRADDKQVDHTYPYLFDEYEEKLQKLIADAEGKGLEIFQPTTGNNAKYKPTLIIGSYVYDNNVLRKKLADNLIVPHLNLVTFRTVKEGINLANNRRNEMFAISVWLESAALENEVITKLNTGTIWVNCHGIFRPEIGFAVTHVKNFGLLRNFNDDHGVAFRGSKDLENIDLEIRKAATIWNNKTFYEKTVALRNVALKLRDFKGLNKSDLDRWIETLLSFPNTVNGLNFGQVATHGNHLLKRFQGPLGVIYIETKKNFENVVIAALLAGNGLCIDLDIIFNEEETKFLQYFSDNLLHPGLIVVSNLSMYWPNGLISDKPEVHVCDLFNYMSNVKNVWTTIGENF